MTANEPAFSPRSAERRYTSEDGTEWVLRGRSLFVAERGGERRATKEDHLRFARQIQLGRFSRPLSGLPPKTSDELHFLQWVEQLDDGED